MQINNGSQKSFARSGSAWRNWIIIVSAALVFFAAASGFFASFIVSRFSLFETLFLLSPTNVSLPQMNILLLGIDATGGAKRSDTIMVLHVNPRDKSVSVVSIPRDTLVVIPGVRLDKINHAYAFGGPELAASTTSSFLGIPINYYIKINISGLAKIIDEIGGVEVDVDQRMYYVDYAGGLFIDLKPGLQKLSGKEAIGFLRFRHDALGDIGRIKRQQKFLQDLANQMAKSKNPLQIYNLISDMIESVDTNLTTSQIFSLASTVRQAYEFGSVYVSALPGSGTKIDGIYYMQPDMERVKAIVNRYLKNRSEDVAPQSDEN